MRQRIPLEAAAQMVCDQSAVPPLIFQLPPEEGRRRLEEAQNAPVYLYPADTAVRLTDTGGWGRVPVYLVRPLSCRKIRHVIFYIHGGGWVFGSFHTHEKLVRELAARTESLVVFPEYARAPEARYPTALNQCFRLLSMLWELTEPEFPDLNRHTLTIAGDSAGGNLAIAVSLMACQEGGPYIQKQLLYYPVVHACFQTPSYRQFAWGYYLYQAGMQWFWQQYAPNPADRRRITASPLRADERLLQQMPPTMVINGQADVLCSEGEAFAARLLRAGADVTAVQIRGMIHDFVMLNALDQTNGCRTAMDASVQWIRRKNQEVAYICEPAG